MGCAKGRQQQLYARIVALERDFGGDPITDVFKHIGNGQHMNWDGKMTQNGARDKHRHASGVGWTKRRTLWHWETRADR